MSQEELQKQLLIVVEKILGPDGVMVCSSPHYRYNSHQFAYAKQVVYGFCRFRDSDMAAAVNMLQAATGTGKSLGYLVPAFAYAALTGERVMVSTFTRSLQHQLLEKDAPNACAWVDEVLGKKVTFARRVGRQNYLSLSACQELRDRLESEDVPNQPALDFIAGLIDWMEVHAERAPIIDDYLDEIGEDEVAFLPAGIERSSISISALSPPDEIELYQNDVAKSCAVDVVIVNHALVMLDASRWAKVLDGQDRKTKVLICDEADRLTAAAESVLSADVSLHRLAQLTEAVSESCGISGVVEAVKALNELAVKTESHNNSMAAMPPALVAELNNTVNALRPYAEQFSKQLESPQVELVKSGRHNLLAAFCDSYNDLSRVAAASRTKDSLSIISWSPVRHFPSLRVGSPEPARVITRLLAPMNWDSGDSEEVLPPRSYLHAALFTSATLAVAGRSLPVAFDSFASRIGVIRHCRAGSNQPVHNVTADLFRMFDAPYGFGQMKFVLADSNAPLPSENNGGNGDGAVQVVTSQSWLDYCASMIRAASSMPARVPKVLVLTNSYDDTDALAERLSGVEGLIVARRGDPLSALKAQYCAAERAVLIGPNCWEGLDLPGMVSNLVITRLPYTSITGPRLEMHEASLRQRGYSDDKISKIKFGMMSQDARQRFSQGLGRGIRRHDDDVRVWIADPRFPLPDEFASSLDPILMGQRLHVASAFADCIPQRFVEAYKHSKIFTVDGVLHTPELI
ncbi:ATP-dependent DNA helicase [Pseudomonas aeruginosa]|jgi:ATP-dependent DNA helicase DinG